MAGQAVLPAEPHRCHLKACKGMFNHVHDVHEADHQAGTMGQSGRLCPIPQCIRGFTAIVSLQIKETARQEAAAARAASQHAAEAALEEAAREAEEAEAEALLQVSWLQN